MARTADAMSHHAAPRECGRREEKTIFPPSFHRTPDRFGFHIPCQETISSSLTSVAVHPPDRSSQGPRFPPTGAVTLWGRSWHDRGIMADATNTLFNAANLACRRGERAV